MVSLSTRFEYQLNIKDNPKVEAFNNLLNDNQVQVPNRTELNESDSAYYGLLVAIQKKNKKLFDESYKLISKRNPDRDSNAPFIHDDFLILTLIIAVLKFKESKTWLQKIVKLRSRDRVTITMENMLNENFKSSSNSFEITISFLWLYKPELLDSDITRLGFKQIKENTQLFSSQHEILILCGLKSYDLILESRDSEFGRLAFLGDFERRFLRRTVFFFYTIYNISLVLLLYFLADILHKSSDYVKEYINEIGLILGVVGLGVIGGNSISSIRNYCKNQFLKLFGYQDSFKDR